MSHIKLNYAFLMFWNIFVEIHRKILFLVKKVTISERLKYLERFFSQQVWKGQIQKTIGICCKQLYLFKQKNVTNIKKTVCLLKMGHIPPNYTFLLFWSIFVLIDWKILFLVKKVTISERSTEKLRKFVFLEQARKGPNPEENLDFLNIFFLSNR